MSTLVPSASARPLVTSGTAVTPPDPVDVATPAAVRLNQTSSVNVDAPRAGAAPNVTYWLVPLNWRPVAVDCATTEDRWISDAMETAATIKAERNLPGFMRVF